jgi:glycosyltransferase involved in cell wall biosynthesis
VSRTSESKGFRIVQVVSDIAGGGVEIVAYQLAKAWQNKKIENLTVTRSLGERTAVLDCTQHVASFVSRVQTRGAFRYFGRLLVVPAFTFAATSALRGHRDAVVLSHGDSLSGDVLVIHAVNAASLAAKRRAGSWKWAFNPMHAWIAARERYMIGGLRYRRFIAVSQRVGAELEAFYGVPPELITVIPNGVDLDRFRPDPAARDRIRREFSIGDSDRVLLFVGHEFGRKGLEHVIGALEKLDESVKLLVVGSDSRGPYERMFTGKPDRLIFAGERSDLPALYAAADVFVLPTQYEAWALVGLEAMASGLPVFATRVGGFEDYLQDGVNGYVVEQHDGDIAAKIAPVLRDPEALAKLGNGGRATARDYAWDIIAARYTQVLKNVWEEKIRAGERNAALAQSSTDSQANSTT